MNENNFKHFYKSYGFCELGIMFDNKKPALRFLKPKDSSIDDFPNMKQDHELLKSIPSYSKEIEKELLDRGFKQEQIKR